MRSIRTKVISHWLKSISFSFISLMTLYSTQTQNLNPVQAAVVFSPWRNLELDHGTRPNGSVWFFSQTKNKFYWHWRVSPSYITLSIILGPESGQIRPLQKFYCILMIWCCLLDGQAGATLPSLTIKPSRPWKQLWLYVKGFVLAVQKILFDSQNPQQTLPGVLARGKGGHKPVLFCQMFWVYIDRR